jgi:hypothetical protein
VTKAIGFAVVLSCLLAGCALYPAVDAMKRVDVGDDITVDPQVQWASVVDNRLSKVWTVDGFGLDELRFYTGVAERAPLLPIYGAERRDLGRYSATMLPDDVMELVSSTLAKTGNQQLRTEGLRPVPFGTVTGFRFDLEFTTADGLQMKGAALFAQRRKKLDLLLYMAPAEYYFDRYAQTVDRIFESVMVPDRPAAMAKISAMTSR